MWDRGNLFFFVFVFLLLLFFGVLFLLWGDTSVFLRMEEMQSVLSFYTFSGKLTQMGLISLQ